MVKKRHRRDRESRGRQAWVAATPSVVDAPRLPPELRGGLALPLGYAGRSDDDAGVSDQPRIAILLHLYFDGLAPEFWGYLRGFPRPADLYVTTDTEEKRDALRAQFAGWSRGRLDVRLVPNRGRDIAPRIVGLGEVLAGYELCLHLHGKHSHHWTRGGEWRTHLLGSLLGPGMVDGVVEAFRQCPQLGVVMPRNWPAVVPAMSWGFDLDRARAVAARMEIAVDERHALDFPAGSMYWSRAGALQPLLDLELDFTDFEPEDGLPRGSLAHAIERLLLLICERAGFDWLRISADLPPPAHFERAISPAHLRGIVAQQRLRLGQDTSGVPFGMRDWAVPRFAPDWVAEPRITLLLANARALPRDDPGGGGAILGRLPVVADGAVRVRIATTEPLRGHLPPELRDMPLVGLEPAGSVLPLAAREVILAICWKGAMAAIDLRDRQHRCFDAMPPKLWFLPPPWRPTAYQRQAIAARASDILVLDAPWSTGLEASCETIALPAIWDTFLPLPGSGGRRADPPVLLVDWPADGPAEIRTALIAALSEMDPPAVVALGDGEPFILADGRRVDAFPRRDGAEWFRRLTSASLGLAPPWNGRPSRLRHEMSAFGLPVIDATDWPADAATLTRRIVESLATPPPPVPILDAVPAPFLPATALDHVVAALAARLTTAPHAPSGAPG